MSGAFAIYFFPCARTRARVRIKTIDLSKATNLIINHWVWPAAGTQGPRWAGLGGLGWVGRHELRWPGWHRPGWRGLDWSGSRIAGDGLGRAEPAWGCVGAGCAGKGRASFACYDKFWYSFSNFKKSPSKIHRIFPQFECPETNHFEGVLAIYIDFSVSFVEIAIND